MVNIHHFYMIILVHIICAFKIDIKNEDLKKFNIEDEESTKYFSIIDIATNITDKWDISQKTMIIMDQERLLNFNSISKYVPHLVFTKNVSFRISNCNRIEKLHPTMLLILMRNTSSSLDKALDYHRYSDTLLLIYISHISPEEDDKPYYWLKRLFLECWNEKTLAVVLAFWCKSSQSMHLFTYDVFTHELFNETGRRDFRNLFDRFSRDLRGYEMKSCLIDDPPYTILERNMNGTYDARGVEGLIFNTIVKALNVRNDTVKPYSNVTLVAASEMFAKSKSCDVLFTKTVTPGNLYEMEDLMSTLDFDYWCIMVPKGPRLFGIYNLIMPFKKYVWFSYIFITFFVIFGWYALRRLRKYLSSIIPDYEADLIELGVYGLTLNQTSHAIFVPLAGSIRILLVSIVLYSMLLTSAYQSRLMGFLMRPLFQDDPHTVEDVVQSGLPILVYPSELQYWISLNNSAAFSQGFLDSLVPTLTKSMLMEGLLMNDRSQGYLLTLGFIEFVIDTKRYPDGRAMYHRVQECIHPMTYTYAATCDFPFSRRLDELYHRLVESGLRSYWLKNLDIKIKENGDDQQHDHGAKGISVDNLVGSLVFWVVGLGVAVLAFVAELLWWNKHHMKTKLVPKNRRKNVKKLTKRKIIKK